MGISPNPLNLTVRKSFLTGKLFPINMTLLFFANPDYPVFGQ